MHVALLLFMGFGRRQEIKIVPSLDIELPFKKKGHPFQCDFVIRRKISEESPGSSTGIVIHRKSVPVMIIEVKAVISGEFDQIKAHECI